MAVRESNTKITALLDETENLNKALDQLINPNIET